MPLEQLGIFLKNEKTSKSLLEGTMQLITQKLREREREREGGYSNAHIKVNCVEAHSSGIVPLRQLYAKSLQLQKDWCKLKSTGKKMSLIKPCELCQKLVLQNITIKHVIEAFQNDLTFLGGEEV